MKKKWEPYNPDAQKDRRINFAVWLLCAIAVIGVLYASITHGAPYLACDPTDNSKVAGFQVELDGTWGAVIDLGNCSDKSVGCVWVDPIDGKSHFIARDVGPDPDGINQYRMRWIEASGREGLISVPFEYDHSLILPPGLRIIP